MKRKYVGRARSLRRRQTRAEYVLWNQLRNRQFYNLKFRRQHPIGEYIVDLVCLEKKLVIEVDGFSHRLTRSQDERRDSELMRRGYRVLRFWNEEVERDLISVLHLIESALNLGADKTGE